MISSLQKENETLKELLKVEYRKNERLSLRIQNILECSKMKETTLNKKVTELNESLDKL